MKQDYEVLILYWLYNNSITPEAVRRIEHELIKSSALMLYLYQKGISISKIASAIYAEGKNERG